MRNSDIIDILIQKYNYLSSREVKIILSSVFNYIKEELKNGNRVEIRGFGVFEAKTYKEKKFFNPRTLKHEYLPERKVPFYKSSIVLKQRINKT